MVGVGCQHSDVLLKAMQQIVWANATVIRKPTYLMRRHSWVSALNRTSI
jgi:hypothetical protein